MKSIILKVFIIGFFILLRSFVSHSQEVHLQQNGKMTAKSQQSNSFYEGLSLFGGLTLNKQTINDAGITAPLNYLYNNVHNNVFKAGYSGGLRWDGIFHRKHYYSLMIAVNSTNTGNAYSNKYQQAPFLEEFTHFKADNQFTTICIAAHYKKLLPINEMSKYKFYAILGPSFDYKISSISAANLINGAGNRAFVNGDLGVEFDNKGYYMLYAHYKFGTQFANSSARIETNRLEMGMSIKINDLF